MMKNLKIQLKTSMPLLLLHTKTKRWSFSVDGLMKEPFDMVDEHIDTFIQTGRRRWDFGRLIFDRDPIYDIEGSPQEKGFELSSSEDYFSCVYDSYVWEPDDDMITDLFEDSQPLSSSILEEYQDVATSERSEAHSTKRKYFHIEDFYRDSKIKRVHFSLPRPEPVPYLISSSQGNHEVFLGPLISSQSSGSNDHVQEDEDEPSSTYSIPLQRWIDQACGYHFRQDSLHDQS
jgi:hypothetical protein